jgi:hypothetical protein
MATDLGQVHIRLGDDAKRVDRYIEHMRQSTGLDLSRAEAVRSLLVKALSTFEEDAGKKGGRK